MKTPWVNPLLLIILIVQTVTGLVGMLNNQAQFDWVLWTHGIGAYMLVLLAFYKGNIIFSAIQRKRKWTRQRLMFLVTVGLLLLTLGLGLSWTFIGPTHFLTISSLSWHIYVAVPVMILMLWHTWHMRFIFKLPTARNRRAFLAGGITALAGIATYASLNVAKKAAGLPGAVRRFTGSFEKGSFGGWFPSVVWIADQTLTIDPSDYQLTIKGAVNKPSTLSYADLRSLATDQQTATLDCTGGWYTTQIWDGVLLATLLDLAQTAANAQSITIRSKTGYARRFGLDEAAQILLALDVAGGPLSAGHGFPLRAVVENRRGVDWVKWITEIEVNTTAAIWQAPLPLQ